jgi:hypothetical protein
MGKANMSFSHKAREVMPNSRACEFHSDASRQPPIVAGADISRIQFANGD